MAYDPLRKLFYMDGSSQRYERSERLAKARIEAESTFRTGIRKGSDEFFLAVPRELSVLNEQVLRHERKISACLRELPLVARRATVCGLVIDEVVSTNDMEGVYSTRRQINELLHGQQAGSDVPDRRRFRELAKLYLDLFDAQPSMPQTPGDVRGIYERVMQGEPLEDADRPDGRVFRRGEVEVVGSGGKAVHAGLYPESAITEAIERMLALANSDELPQTYGAIVAHFLFEYAHPFYDGNGRTGRYLLALHLSRPLSTLTTLSLSRVLAQNRAAYYRSFREAEHTLNHGELTHFVVNILENVRLAQGELDETLTRKRDGLDVVMAALEGFQGRHGLSRKEVDIVLLLAQLSLFAAFPEATQEEVAQHVGLSVQQSRTYTKRLQEAGIIRAVSRRPLRFVLADGAATELSL